MHLAYIDESSTRDGRYYFAAVLATAEQAHELTRSLDDLMWDVQVASGHRVTAGAELHAKDLFGGNGPWDNVAPGLRAWAAEQVVVRTVQCGATICARGVHGPRLRARQARENYPEDFTVEQEAFKHLLQRIDMFAKLRDSYALAIADDRSDREAHRQLLRLHRNSGTPGAYWRTNFDVILDTLHFAPSHHSRMLQAADHIAFFYRRRAEIREERNSRLEALAARIERAIESASYQCGCWMP